MDSCPLSILAQSVRAVFFWILSLPQLFLPNSPFDGFHVDPTEIGSCPEIVGATGKIA
ncbi:MAG: hypothetical protein LBI05_01475 [Planctomycetaceae bacterium]|nr:hypothetical protein [Planctomycetaceae bacterium]